VALVLAWLHLVRISRLLKRQSLAAFIATMGGEPLAPDAAGEVAREITDIPGLAHAVERAARGLNPVRTTCLIKACTLARLRRYAGLPSVLVIGFAADGTGKIRGHAWLLRTTAEGIPFTEGGEHIVTAAYLIPRRPRRG